MKRAITRPLKGAAAKPALGAGVARADLLQLFPARERKRRVRFVRVEAAQRQGTRLITSR